MMYVMSDMRPFLPWSKVRMHVNSDIRSLSKSVREYVMSDMRSFLEKRHHIQMYSQSLLVHQKSIDSNKHGECTRRVSGIACIRYSHAQKIVAFIRYNHAQKIVAFIRYTHAQKIVAFIRYTHAQKIVTFIRYTDAQKIVTFIRYTHAQKIVTSNNIKIFGNKKIKGLKQNRQIRLSLPIPDGREP